MTNERDKTKRQEMKFGRWFILTKYGRCEKEFVMDELKKPYKVGGVLVPDDLNSMKMGQLVELQTVKDVNELFFVTARVLLGIDKERLMECRATEVVRFAGFVTRELKKINKMFEKTNRKPNKEEKMAGIEKLNFGPFGLVDWYARRMGIREHEKVMEVPWIMVYQCLKIDSELDKYNERLRRVYDERRK